MKNKNYFFQSQVCYCIMTILMTLAMSGCYADVDGITTSNSSSLGLSTDKKNYSVSTLSPLDDVMMQAFYWNVPVDETNLNGT